MAVAIIGGGIAGLCCAYFLKKRGVDLCLHGKKKEVGGRFSTLEIYGVHINRGPLMFSEKLNPLFSSLVDEPEIEYREMDKSKFAVQIGDKIIRLNREGLIESGIFSLDELKRWTDLQNLVKILRFDYKSQMKNFCVGTNISFSDFCKKEMGFSDKMINYLVQLYASFQYVEPHKLAADKGLFSIAYSIHPTYNS